MSNLSFFKCACVAAVMFMFVRSIFGSPLFEDSASSEEIVGSFSKRSRKFTVTS